MDTLQSVWEQELYSEIQYKKKDSMLHSFEGDTTVIGLSFMDDNEANHFHLKVQERIDKRRTRTAQLQSQTPRKTKTVGIAAGPNLDRRLKQKKDVAVSEDGGSSWNFFSGKK